MFIKDGETTKEAFERQVEKPREGGGGENKKLGHAIKERREGQAKRVKQAMKILAENTKNEGKAKAAGTAMRELDGIMSLIGKGLLDGAKAAIDGVVKILNAEGINSGFFQKLVREFDVQLKKEEFVVGENGSARRVTVDDIVNADEAGDLVKKLMEEDK